jgi:enamine deaminase RidA (YjgF/YER057c/UK114 family)
MSVFSIDIGFDCEETLSQNPGRVKEGRLSWWQFGNNSTQTELFPIKLETSPMNGCHFERDRGFVLWQCAKGPCQVYITISFDQPASDTASVCRRAYAKLAAIIEREGLIVVQERVFGSLNHHAAVLAGRLEAFPPGGSLAAQPVTYIQGRPLWGDGLAGIQIHAVRSGDAADKVVPLTDGHRIVGQAWTHRDTTLLWTQNTHGLGADNRVLPSPKAQSESMFLRADALLRSLALDYSAVVRTWIYLSDILRWYDDFNEVRNRLYGGWGLMPNPIGNGPLRLPASTGIRGDNPWAASCVMDWLAIKPASVGAPAVKQLTNLKQKDAFKYQKAFSRGAFLQGAGFDQIQISGTAAIDEVGGSLFPGNVRQQIQCTLEVVASLIEPCGARLNEISGATLFLKAASDAELCRHVLKDCSLEHLPAVWVVGDVCRDELLFEMDAVALGPFSHPVAR